MYKTTLHHQTPSMATHVSVHYKRDATLKYFLR